MKEKNVKPTYFYYNEKDKNYANAQCCVAACIEFYILFQG